MTVPEAELVRLLGAVLALLLASQLVGGLFQRLGQPKVVGEIGGGLLLGPTVLGALAPSAYGAMFERTAGHGQALAFVFWLGLLLLMFCSGLETPTVRGRQEWRTVAWLTAVGTSVPLVAGGVAAALFDFSAFFGPEATPLTFGLVLALAIAVTSIPVIAKIFLDLGIAGTPFARVVLSAAMIEDILLWVVLSVTLGLARGSDGGPLALAIGVATAVAYFAVGLGLGPRLCDAMASAAWSPLRHLPEGVAVVTTFLAAALTAAALGVNPVFGAFVAGRIVARAQAFSEASRAQVKGFSLAFFVPVYLASVGLELQLDLHFPVAAFALVVAFACAVKASSAYAGALLAGQPRAQSLHLAIAMNARGGPGIVLATVTREAGLINDACYAILVMLALVTSQLAGWWLGCVLRRSPAELELAPGAVGPAASRAAIP